MTTTTALALLTLPACAPFLWAQTLDVPLTVEERSGIARRAEPVTFGVPLPKGLLHDTARLRLYGPDGEPVPAAFRVVNRWWDEASSETPSIQWVHGDFFADAPTHGRTVYHLRLSDEAPRAPVGRAERALEAVVPPN